MNQDHHTTHLQELLDQLQGDSDTQVDQARNALIEHSMQRLEQLTRNMLRSSPRLKRWEQTDDVLQNAMLRLYRSLVSVRPESVRQFYGLAATQIRRELIDLARHHFGPMGDAANHLTDGNVPLGERGKRLVNEPANSSRPETLAQWTEFHEGVEKLPDEEREVFQLLWYEGITQKEAANLVGVSERTIKSRWRNAKILLRELVGGENPA